MNSFVGGELKIDMQHINLIRKTIVFCYKLENDTNFKVSAPDYYSPISFEVLK
jgi:hypothetical protein